jgi:hypothetical protein
MATVSITSNEGKLSAASAVLASSSAQSNSHFIWPLSKSLVPDETDTSFGPRIDIEYWSRITGREMKARRVTPS